MVLWPRRCAAPGWPAGPATVKAAARAGELPALLPHGARASCKRQTRRPKRSAELNL
jgi:hypothetical protein